MKKVLIIDEVHELLIEGLKTNGFDVCYIPLSDRNEIIEHINETEILVIRMKTPVDEDLLRVATKLKYVARAGVGLDGIDTAYCEKAGIKWFNSGEANADAVGEQTIGMLIGLMAKIIKSDDEVRRRIWDREGNRGTELMGKTIGIIGYGNTGKAVARKISGFGMKVLAYDKYLKNYSDTFAQESGMQNIFSEADIVTFHVPLTFETKGMVNNDYMCKFSKNIFLLNLSRGKVLNTADLVENLKTGKIIAAGLDVLENENLYSLSTEENNWFNYLSESYRTILTPHIGGLTSESHRRISEVLLDKICRLVIEH